LKPKHFFILLFILCCIFAGFLLLTQEKSLFNSNTGTQTTIANESKSQQPLKNETYWIKIDPIPDHHPGDQFFVNGSTNLPPDDELTIEVFNYYQYPGVCGPGAVCQYSSFSNITKIVRSHNGNYTFSSLVNTSGFYPLKFRVRIFSNRFQILEESSFYLN